MIENEIEIDLSGEYKVKIEDVGDFETSIFSKVYLSARENVLSILDHSNDSKNSYDSYNNIIAFTGERGKGKSSAMISFLEALKRVGEKIERDSFLSPFYVDKKEAAKYSFIDLDVIDPSLFKGNETLFEIVLAKMFSKFKHEIETSLPSNSNLITDEKRRLIVKLFQSVFENLKYTNGNYKDELYKQEALDALIKLSASSNLKESFKALVKDYLEVMRGRTKTESFLVISIDDFDLKIEGVYEMLEDVRQFLISENVIVLIACKMEQMQQAVEMTIHKHFGNTLGIKPNYYGNFQNSDNEIKNKGRKYLEKLFPISRQIKLPGIELLTLNNLIKNAKSEKNDLKILEVIYLKQGIFFSSDNVINHIIYDDTLRSLVNLLHSIDTGAVELFIKYGSFRFSEFIEEQQLATLLNCDIKLINTFVTNILIEDFEYSIDEYHITELRKLSNSKNYEIIQNGDVNSLIYSITEKINVNDVHFTKLKAITSIYIIRTLSDYIQNQETLKLKSLSGILSARHFDPKKRIPYNSFNRKYRDYFKVNSAFREALYDEDQLIVITAFIQNLGNNDRDYMISDDNLFLNSARRSGAPHRHFYFSIYSFITSPNNITKLYERFRESGKTLPQLENKWLNSRYNKLFMSYDFVIEFNENLIEAYRSLSKSGDIKSEANENLYSNLHVLFSKGIEQVFLKLNEKYQYLNLNFEEYINDHGIIKLFLEKVEDPRIKEFINQSFDKYEYVKTYSSINSLDEIQYVNNVDPLIEIMEFLKKERINKKPFQDLINSIDDKDFEIRDFLLQKNYFDRLFSTNVLQKNRTRDSLNKHLKRLVENGQSQE